MLYSCFDPQSGLYDVFEDGATHPVNGDLPVPQLSSNDYAGTVGVPSIEAGRKLPSSAVHVGKSWNAKGLVVNCNANESTSGLGEMTKAQAGFQGLLIGVIIGLGLAAWVIFPDRW